MVKDIILERYWLKQLEGGAGRIDLGSRTGAATTGRSKSVYRVEIPGETIARVSKLVNNTDIGRYCYFVAALNLVIYKYTGQKNTILNVPEFNFGKDYNQENICFLRNALDDRQTLREVLMQHRITLLDCYKHQEYYYQDLIDKFLIRNPPVRLAECVQVGLVDESIQYKNKALETCDLVITLSMRPGYGLLTFEYTAYDPVFVEQFGAHYLKALDTYIDHLHVTPRDFTLMDEARRQGLAGKCRDTEEATWAAAMHALFEQAAAAAPGIPAVYFGNAHLTYEALNKQSNQLANYLIERYRIVPGQVVAVCMESSPDLLASILAVLKCGASVLPLVPTDPEERAKHMLNDSNARLLVVNPFTANPFGWNAGPEAVLCLAQHGEAIGRCGDWNLGLVVDPDQVAYLIYTSGSTGKPKGVCLTHRNLCNQFAWFRSYFGFAPSDVLPQKTAISFVDSVIELLFPITLGGSSVYLRPYHALTQDVQAFLEWLREIKPTLMQLSPSHLDNLLETENLADVTSLRALILSGEAVKKQYPFPFDVYNLYGCSECSAASTIEKLDPASGVPPTIGKPISNTQVYILDEQLNFVPEGGLGEICIGGLGVSKGYLNNEAFTAERFVAGPAGTGKVIYRTGDNGRMLPDGRIEYVGRKDYQVKIRGNRVELGEVERYLLMHPKVANAVTVARDDDKGNKELAAFVVKAGTNHHEALPALNRPEDAPKLDFSLFYFASQNADRYENKYQLLLDTAAYADQHGFTAIWTPERHFHAFGGIFPDPAVLGAALAMRTSRINIRAGSVVLPLHDEVRVAEQWSVVDNLSGGRVSLSVASGWHADDFIFFPEDYRRRHAKMYQQIEVLKSLWAGHAVTRRNGMGKEVAVSVLPRPVQSKLPLWITSGGTKDTFYSAGKMGANIVTNLLTMTVEELAANIIIYRKALQEHGHPADQAKVALMIHTYLGNDLQTVKAEVREPFKAYLGSSLGLISNLAKSRGVDLHKEMDQALEDELLEAGFEKYWQSAALTGTPDSCDPLIRKLAAIGVNEIACLIDFGVDYDKVMKSLALVSTLKDKYNQEDTAVFRQKAAEAVKASPALAKLYGEEIDGDQVRSFLKSRVPAYMIPAHIVFLDAFPLNTSGKTDRLALQQMEIETGGAAYVAPRNGTEEKLVRIWQDILGRKHVGIHDNFTDLGGHSLRATRLISRIHKDFSVQIKLKDVYTCATVAGLAQRIGESAQSTAEVIPPAAPKAYYEVSNSQKRIWIIDQIGINKSAYNLAHEYFVRGDFHVEAFERAFASLVERHESLRTTFVVLDGEPKQRIHDPDVFPFRVEHVYLTGLDPQHQHLTSRQLINQESAAPFALDSDPLLRVKVLHLDAQQYIVLLTMHHIIADGWSMNILFKELILLYNTYRHGGANPLRPLSLQYKDYAEWHNRKISDGFRNSHQQYWMQKLGGEIEPLRLPVDKPRRGVRTFNGAMHRHLLNGAASSRLREFNKANDVTMFVSLVTLINVLLYKYTHQQDIVVGSPVTGRSHGSLEDQIGIYLNNLVLRNQVNGEEPYRLLLYRVRQTTIEAFDHQDYPYDLLVNDLKVQATEGRNPFYDVMVVMGAGNAVDENGPDADFENLQLRRMGHQHTVSKLDLSFFLMDTEEISIDIEYATDLFTGPTIERMGKDFQQLVDALLDNPDATLDELKKSILTSQEIDRYEEVKGLVLEKVSEEF